MENRDLRAVIRNLLIELVAYSLLVLLYSIGVIRWLGEPLNRLFGSNLLVYSGVSLALIVAQGAVLDVLTTFLLDQLPIERLE